MLMHHTAEGRPEATEENAARTEERNPRISDQGNVLTGNDEMHKALMTRKDHAGDKPGETAGFAEQPGTDKAADGAAQTQAQPDSKTGGRVQHGGAVWDQPLPWLTSADEKKLSAPQAQPPQGEPAAAGESTTAQVDTGTGGEADGTRNQAESLIEDEVAVAAASLTPGAPQSAAAQLSSDKRVTPVPLSARAVGNAVSRRVLGVAVAVGGLMAAVGGVVAFHPGPSADHLKQEAGAPITAPDDNGDAAAPAPPATSQPVTHSVPGKKAHPPALHAVKSAPMAKHFAVGNPVSVRATSAIPQVGRVSHTLASNQHQQSYLSVSTSVYTPNSYWSQSAVTLTTKVKLTALKIAVRIHQTGGVRSTGGWSPLDDRVSVHSAVNSQELDYTLTLNPGAIIEPGTYTFEFQYNHNEGTRDTSRDYFAVTATAPGSAGTESKQGRF
jgi:hypothetical protein